MHGIMCAARCTKPAVACTLMDIRMEYKLHCTRYAYMRFRAATATSIQNHVENDSANKFGAKSEVNEI